MNKFLLASMPILALNAGTAQAVTLSWPIGGLQESQWVESPAQMTAIYNAVVRVGEANLWLVPGQNGWQVPVLTESYNTNMFNFEYYRSYNDVSYDSSDLNNSYTAGEVAVALAHELGHSIQFDSVILGNNLSSEEAANYWEYDADNEAIGMLGGGDASQQIINLIGQTVSLVANRFFDGDLDVANAYMSNVTYGSPYERAEWWNLNSGCNWGNCTMPSSLEPVQLVNPLTGPNETIVEGIEQPVDEFTIEGTIPTTIDLNDSDEFNMDWLNDVGQQMDGGGAGSPPPGSDGCGSLQQIQVGNGC